MNCPYCNAQTDADARFCTVCGNDLAPAEQLQAQELETLSRVFAHFSQKEQQYKDYDRVCEQIVHYGPGSSMTPFYIAGIIAVIASLAILVACIGGAWLPAAYIFLLSQIPCFFLVGGCLLVYRKNRINYRNCCQKYLELGSQLQLHYQLYPKCPVACAYTNPQILNAIRVRLEKGHAPTIAAGSEQIISGVNREKMDNHLARLEHYTAHLPQPQPPFLPGKYFSANPSNLKDIFLSS